MFPCSLAGDHLRRGDVQGMVWLVRALADMTVRQDDLDS
jgi:hypothetical protein